MTFLSHTLHASIHFCCCLSPGVCVCAFYLLLLLRDGHFKRCYYFFLWCIIIPQQQKKLMLGNVTQVTQDYCDRWNVSNKKLKQFFNFDSFLACFHSLVYWEDWQKCNQKNIKMKAMEERKVENDKNLFETNDINWVLWVASEIDRFFSIHGHFNLLHRHTKRIHW